MTRTKHTSKITAAVLAIGLALSCAGARLPRRAATTSNRPAIAASK